MKILPSPMRSVLAACWIASTARSTRASSSTTSIFTFGRKSTTYSAPRYSSVWPFWRPKPFTSVTVMPCTPIAESASRTSSSLNGLMIAVTSFILRLLSERLRDREHDRALAGFLGAPAAPRVIPGLVGVRVHVGGAEDPAVQVVGHAELPVLVVELAVLLDFEHSVVRDDRKLLRHRDRRGEIEIPGAVGTAAAAERRARG